VQEDGQGQDESAAKLVSSTFLGLGELDAQGFALAVTNFNVNSAGGLAAGFLDGNAQPIADGKLLDGLRGGRKNEEAATAGLGHASQLGTVFFVYGEGVFGKLQSLKLSTFVSFHRCQLIGSSAHLSIGSSVALTGSMLRCSKDGK